MNVSLVPELEQDCIKKMNAFIDEALKDDMFVTPEELETDLDKLFAEMKQKRA